MSDDTDTHLTLFLFVTLLSFTAAEPTAIKLPVLVPMFLVRGAERRYNRHTTPLVIRFWWLDDVFFIVQWSLLLTAAVARHLLSANFDGGLIGVFNGICHDFFHGNFSETVEQYGSKGTIQAFFSLTNWVYKFNGEERIQSKGAKTHSIWSKPLRWL